MTDKNYLTFKESGEESVELTFSVDTDATWDTKLKLFLKFLRLQGYVLPVQKEEDALEALSDSFLFEQEEAVNKKSYRRTGELPPYLKLIYSDFDEKETAYTFNPYANWIELLEEFMHMLNKQENGPGYQIDPETIKSIVAFANLSLFNKTVKEVIPPLDIKSEF